MRLAAALFIAPVLVAAAAAKAVKHERGSAAEVAELRARVAALEALLQSHQTGATGAVESDPEGGEGSLSQHWLGDNIDGPDAASAAALVMMPANWTAKDDGNLSCYTRTQTCSQGGPELERWRAMGVPFVPFITLTEAHSGSTWFRTMLNSHPCVRSHGELLRQHGLLKDLWKTLGMPTNTDKDGAHVRM